MATEQAAGFFVENAWAIPLYPIIAAAIVTFLGLRMQRGGGVLTIGAIGLSLVHSILVFTRVLQGVNHHASWEWITLETHTISMGILVDNLSAFLMLLVSFLALLISIYSWGYMSGEGTGQRRYYAEVALFVGGMLGTVLADNFLLMFIFWEIMGLCSYLLIGFWFHKRSAASASLKAFLVTRVGDVMLLVGFSILFVHYGTFAYRELFERVGESVAAGTAEMVPLTFAGLMIFGGAVGKSAQFPLHVWLPDAMEGPTTVSALIHAATMVKAGVYLVARSYPIFVHTPDVFLVIGIIGGFTAFFAATMALVMYDIKRILAYSTLSQLGYMFLGLGAGGLILVHTGNPIGYAAGIFHLMTHAFFKALLFLGAGSVGHAFHHAENPYDLRQMGGLHNKMKITSVTMLIGSLAIAGIPPLAGFWSKDEVLAAAFEAGSQLDQTLLVFWGLGLLTALMTAFYMFRLWFNVFTGAPRSEEARHAHESPRSMTTPLVVLSAFALVAGMLFLVPWGAAAGLEPYLAHDLEAYGVTLEHHEFVAGEFVVHLFTSPLTYLSILAAVAGIGIARAKYYGKAPHPVWAERPTGIRRTLLNRWYLNAFTVGLGNFIVGFVANLSALIDRYVIDGIVNGIARLTEWSGDRLRTWQTGMVTTYAATVIVSISILLILKQFLFPYLGW